MKCAAQYLGELRDSNGNLRPASQWRATIEDGLTGRVQTVIVTAEVQHRLEQWHGREDLLKKMFAG